MFIKELHGIRGFAVLSVLVFHFYPEWFPGGFMGVDIFFVLSGFLVSKSLISDFKINPLQSGSEFIRSFYTKRIARILPVSILASSLGLGLQLLFSDTSDIKKVVAFFSSSILGFSNMLLYFEKGNYFSINQDFNFFTQTWSLGIEEQFYFIFSILIIISIFLRKNKKGTLDIFISFIKWSMGLSFFLNIYFLFFQKNSILSFYTLITRWFELSLGCWLSLLIYHKNILERDFVKSINSKTITLVKKVSFVALFLSLFISYDSKLFPFPIVFIVLLPTLFLCFSSNLQIEDSVFNLLKVKPLQWLGDVSFSLYLFHWIVLVVLRHTFGQENFLITTTFLIVSLLISHVIFSFFEKPLNKKLKKQRNISGLLFFLTVPFFIAVYFLNRNDFFTNNPYSLYNGLEVAGRPWISELKCHDPISKKIGNPIETCLNKKLDEGKENNFFVHGDSHAVQITPMISKAIHHSVYQMKYVNMTNHMDAYSFTSSRHIADDHKPEVMEYLNNHVKEGDVVLLTFGAYRLNRTDVDELYYEKAFKLWNNYVKSFLAKGATVILVLDSPEFEKVPISRCLFSEKFFQTQLICQKDLKSVMKFRSRQDQLFNKLQMNNPSLHIYDLMPFFCNETTCSMYKNGTLRYFDSNHFTRQTSEEMGEAFKRFLDSKGLLK